MTQDKRVFIHIGLPKTGTTYLQGVLASNRKQLAQHGILYPGKGQAHFLAAQDLAEHQFLGQENPNVAGAWASLVKESKRWGGDVVISHELLTLAQNAHIAKVVRDLHGAEVHVVATARDLERQIPAVWQERLKNGAKVSFNRHFQQLEEQAQHTELDGFWRQQNLPRILDRWLAVVPPHRIHVVTVPQKGAPRDLLWQRFASTVGISLEWVDPKKQAIAGNVSLSPEQARFLRRVNAAQQIPRPLYISVVKRYLTQKAAVRIDGAVEHGLTQDQRATARRWSRELVEHIQHAGLDVQGDLSEIYPAPDPSSVEVPFDKVDPTREADVAIRMTSALIHWMSTQADDESKDQETGGLRRRLRGFGGKATLGR